MRSREDDPSAEIAGPPGAANHDRRSDMRGAVHPVPRWLLAACVVSLGVALVVAAVGVGSRARAATLLLDPTAAAGVPPWFGAASTVGVIAWVVAGTALVFAGAVLRQNRRDAERVHFLLEAGALAFVVAADDAFLIHEYWLPRHLGVPDAVSYTAYLLWASMVLVRHRRVVRSLDWPPFVGAAAALALSMALDLWFEHTGHLSGSSAFEDLPKLWGAVLVAIGAATESFRAVVRAP
jgi:hypothetical protein